MVTQKASYSFVYDRKKKSSAHGLGMIELVVYFGHQERKFISTRVKVQPNEWNVRKREITGKNPNYIALNLHLREMRDKIEKFELDLINNKKRFNKIKLDEYLKGYHKPITFAQFCRNYSNKDLSVTLGTKRNHQQTIKLLERWCPDVGFDDLNFEWVTKYDNFLRSIYTGKGSIWKHHKNVKRFINLAIKLEKMDANQYPYKYFKLEKASPKQTYLNYKELEAVECADVDGVPVLELVRKRFLASCYTGLRISDNRMLKRSDFIDQEAGLGFKLDRMYKVDRKVHLKLWEIFGGKPEKLFSELLNDDLEPDDSIWPRSINDSDFNKYLKILQEKAGLSKKLTSHVGRHTFGTLYAHQTGSIFDVMKAMGISKFETAQIYIDLSDEL